MLEKLDTLLGRFLDTLEEKGLLGCINLVIISDHGMSRTTNHVILEDFMDLDGLLGLYGAVAQIFRVNTTRTTEDIMDSLGCGTQDNARVFTKETMPIRYHYPKSRRVGDVVVMGVNGAVIHE
ncbi:hypothetical protein TELCIR_09813 [Teladorsagia circumcincta]|uniref:Uncharacterized protein n=1 Tax=Teladorsagia circumcincta TaxID=45464 RepID=A0A2G9UDW5_TELCI|nr:hypothetical protein TELCIR_09813 [Teladorsagia circumcincta]